MGSPPSDARGALLARLIDHAALFPPASLPMPDALEADRRARAGEHAWLLDHFICPASRLAELPAGPPPLSVVLDGEPSASPPVELVEARVAGAGAVAETHARIRETFGDGVRVFLELSLDGELERALEAVRETGAGAKVRCGGEVVPAVDALARFVCACHQAGVPFKATAGLHHAIRRGEAHGFLNLLAAAVFAEEGERTVAALLAEEDPAAFAVTPGGLAVNGLTADAGRIAAARRERFVAYGSCSFSEPVEDLLALGILP